MKRTALIFVILILLLCSESEINIAFAQSSYNVKKVCYGSGRTAMVVEHNSRYYVITTNDNVMFTKDMLIADIPAISIGGQSNMWFARTGGSVRSNFVNVITPGRFVSVNNRLQRFMYSGLPGARSVCRQIAYRY